MSGGAKSKRETKIVAFNLEQVEACGSEMVDTLRRVKKKCGFEDEDNDKALMVMGFVLGNLMSAVGIAIDTKDSAGRAFPGVVAGYESGESFDDAIELMRRASAHVH